MLVCHIRSCTSVIYGYIFNQSNSYSFTDTSTRAGQRDLWCLPGILTACSATYEESSLIWLSRSTVTLDLKDSKFRNMLDRVKSETRGLRTNKATEDCKDYMESLTQFSCITLRLDNHFVSPKGSQGVALATALEFFGILDFSRGKRIVVDLHNLAIVTAAEARDVVQCVREWMDKCPALRLRMGPVEHCMHYQFYFGAGSCQTVKKLHGDLVADYNDRVNNGSDKLLGAL